MKWLTWALLIIAGVIVINALVDNQALRLILCFCWGCFIPYIVKAAHK